MRSDLTAERIRLARAVAVAADLLQVVVVPALWPAAALAIEAIDVVAAVVLFSLLGWHWALLPTFIAELVPFLGLVPTWTAAVLIATRGGATPASTTVVGEPPLLAPPPAQGRRGDSSGS